MLRLAGRACVCLLLLGCSGGNGPQLPTVVLATPTGVVPVYSPPPAMPGGVIGPPANLENTPPVPAQQVDRNGNYTGTAEPLDTGGGLCVTTRKVGNFRVHGNRVRYGGFRGTIDANNGLQMVSGTNWIIGQFEGATFHGQLDLMGRFGSPGCSYMFNLQRTGP
jgi:hypothetical protein